MDDPQDFIERLVKATNDHDLDSIAACFAVDYLNETPAHPARGFRGRSQVRRNWEQILAFVPDLHVEVLDRATNREVIWSEWVMTGTRLDETRHEMRGVILFSVEGGVATSARFYLEPIDTLDTATVNTAVREQVAR